MRAGPLPWFLLAFVASRAVFFACGLRFSTEHVAAIMHFVDLELLRDRLLESLWYLHGQPPLMSVFLGVLLKTSGDAYPLVAQATYVALGAATGGAMVLLLRRLRFSAAVSVAVALAFSLLPSVVVYENYLFSTHPVLACLVLGCLPLHRALERGRRRDWFWFFFTAAVVVNLRNVFHLLWWLGLLALALRLRWPQRRLVLAGAAVPLLLASSFYLKNWAVYGRFEASSWMGFGLARKTYHQLPLDVRRAAVADGRLAKIAGVELFGGVEAYAEVLGRPPPTGVPLLDRELKSSGFINYHHAIYAEASACMRAEALRLIGLFPRAYLHNVVLTTSQLFAPATAWHPVATPRAQIAAYVDLGDWILHRRLGLRGVCVWSVLAGIVLLAFLAKALGALRARRHRAVEDELFVFCGFTLAYLYAVAVLLDTNEAMRHRLKGDGLLVLAAAILLRQLWRRSARLRGRGRRADAGVPG